ncbi:MAG: PAS domain S-box protein [Nitrospiria bacterium]
MESDLAVSDVPAWLSACSPGGICVIAGGAPVFENPRFGQMVVSHDRTREASDREQRSHSTPYATRTLILADASTWSQEALGARAVWRYRGLDAAGRDCDFQARFTVVPLNGKHAVLVVLEDITRQDLLASEAAAVGRFQSVLARIGTLAVSGMPVKDLMSEAASLSAEALGVELCKILIPRESEDHLYLVAGVGFRDELLGGLTVEGGTQSQAGFAIRERRPVVVRDLRTERRFSPSRLLLQHGAVSGMSVPMMVRDRVYGVMGAHAKTVRDFTQKELEFLCTVANTVATVLERWRRDETQLQLYHRLFELVQDGVMLTDTEGRLIEWNPAMERLTGWRHDEVVGRTPALLKSGKHSREFYRRLWHTIVSGQPVVERFVNRRKDGSEFFVWESISPVKDPDGTIRYYLAILTDLTERERLLEAVRQAEQIRLVGQLTGGILHEVRNPLIGIGSLATYLAEKAASDPAVRDSCLLIAQEARRIDELLQSHLQQLPPRAFDFRPCDPGGLLEETLVLLGRKLRAAAVQVRIETDHQLPHIEASPTHLQQVWMNLMINAVEAMPAGGQLSITLARAPGAPEGVLTVFQDSGRGIPTEDLGRIYEPFFTSGKARGVGLGLTISRDIVERHGGRIVISSPLGQGARVEIWLPVRQGG